MKTKLAILLLVLMLPICLGLGVWAGLSIYPDVQNTIKERELQAQMMEDPRYAVVRDIENEFDGLNVYVITVDVHEEDKDVAVWIYWEGEEDLSVEERVAMRTAVEVEAILAVNRYFDTETVGVFFAYLIDMPTLAGDAQGASAIIGIWGHTDKLLEWAETDGTKEGIGRMLIAGEVVLYHPMFFGPMYVGGALPRLPGTVPWEPMTCETAGGVCHTSEVVSWDTLTGIIFSHLLSFLF